MAVSITIRTASLCLLFGAASCASGPAPEPPANLANLTVSRVAGPVYEGNAFPISIDSWLTCRHVVPASATSYRIAGRAYSARPRLAGTSRARSDDWVVLEGPESANRLRVDFDRPLPDGTTVWVVGWIPTGEGRAKKYERAAVDARIAGRAEGSAHWILNGMGDRDYAGLSGAPVVIVDERTDTVTVIGMYIATVRITKTFLGVTYGSDSYNVCIRPPAVE